MPFGSDPIKPMFQDYCDGLVKWLKAKMLREHGYIDSEDLKVFTMADDVETTVKIIRDFKEGPGLSGIKLPNGMKKTPSTPA